MVHVFESLSDGIIVFNEALAIITCNPACATMLAFKDPADLQCVFPRFDSVLRPVGPGPAFRVESRIPGAAVNRYIAFAGVIAAGLHGIENQLDPGDAFVGNAYVDPDVEHIPSTLGEAIDLFKHSEVAKSAFGEEVHQHILNSAEQEWLAFNRAVTDWELRRNFEQL